MGRKSSITPDQGQQLLEAYQRLGSKRAAAAEVGVSWGVARRYFGATGEAAAPIVIQQRDVLTTAGATLWDTRAALSENFQRLQTLIAQIEQGLGAPEGQINAAAPLAALRESREHIIDAVKLQNLLMNAVDAQKYQESQEIRSLTDDERNRRIIAILDRARARRDGSAADDAG